jgi:hypothetical protein
MKTMSFVIYVLKTNETIVYPAIFKEYKYKTLIELSTGFVLSDSNLKKAYIYSENLESLPEDAEFIKMTFDLNLFEIKEIQNGLEISKKDIIDVSEVDYLYTTIDEIFEGKFDKTFCNFFNIIVNGHEFGLDKLCSVIRYLYSKVLFERFHGNVNQIITNSIFNPKPIKSTKEEADSAEKYKNGSTTTNFRRGSGWIFAINNMENIGLAFRYSMLHFNKVIFLKELIQQCLEADLPFDIFFIIKHEEGINEKIRVLFTSE